MTKSKTTVIALVALIVVCAGSFLGVRALNKNTKVQQPVTIITQATTTTVPTTTEPTTAPTTTTQPSTLPTNALAVTDKAGESTSNLFTTFAQSTTAPTTTKPTTTKPTTTKPATTAVIPTTKELTGNETPEELINSAAVFSKGFLGYKYDPEENVYYTNKDPWQRNFGFNELYDVGASFIVFYYDTMRCKFNYANKDWMIQFWKGQYGFVFVGAEIGVYNKPTNRKVEHYDCASDEDSLKMSMTCYRKGKEIFSRQYATYWWCTGFVPGKLDKFSDRSELKVQARITLKDARMLLSFCGALEENGLKLNKNYTTDGLDVFVTW